MVLLYVMQWYVEEKEGLGVLYWDLVWENVLKLIGVEYFCVLYIIEEEEKVIFVFGLGVFFMIDEVVKIVLLFVNEGQYEG